MRRVLAPLLSMFMTAAERESPPAPARADIGRSPFVRLRELLGDYEPGKPAISLAVGEPQHAVPAFVGPVLAAHIDEFGRYPMNKGIDALCEAAAGWLGRRFALPRPIDPAHEVLVLNGSREGLFLAAIAAAGWVTGRRGRPAMLIPNPFYAAYAAGAIAANCEPVYLPATAATGFLPDLDALSEELLARTVAFFIASPANPQGAVADPAYLARIVALARRFGFLVFSDECYSEIYTRDAPAGMLEAAGPDFANVVEFQSLSKRSNLPGLRIGFAAGDRHSSRAFSSCATSPRRRCRCRRSASPSPPMATRRMSKRTAGSTRRNSISPTRSSATATAIGARPAASFFGSTCPRRAATRRSRCGCGGRRACASCPAAISRATGRRLQSGPRLHPRRHGAGPRNHGRGAASPRRGAGLRGTHAGNRPRP